MTKPIIADCKPRKVSLAAGKQYYFCTCGKSQGQPFCDGSHKGSSFSPQPFTVDQDKESWLCACKQTANAPFCDGTHKTLSPEDVGSEG